MTDEPTCALWFWRHGTMGYKLFVTERDASRRADDMHMNAEGQVVGIQFADGLTLRMDEWDFPDDERSDRLPRVVRDPFDGKEQVVVDGNAPDWLGQQ